MATADAHITDSTGPPRWLGFAALLGGSIALALGPLLVRLADTGPVAAGFWRLALALPALVLLAWRRWRGQGQGQGQFLGGFGTATYVLLAAAGLFFGLDLASWHIGILQTKIANATLFGNAASLLLVIYGIIMARKLPAGPQLLAIILAFAGGAILMGQSAELSAKNLRGDALCLLAGVLYTGYMIAMQRVRGTVPSWSALALVTACAALPALVVAVVLGEHIMPDDWGPLIILACTSQIIGQGLLIYALPHFSPLVVGLTLLTQPAVAAVTGWIAFDERLTALDVTGGLLVAAALVLLRLPAVLPARQNPA